MGEPKIVITTSDACGYCDDFKKKMLSKFKQFELPVVVHKNTKNLPSRVGVPNIAITDGKKTVEFEGDWSNWNAIVRFVKQNVDGVQLK